MPSPTCLPHPHFVPAIFAYQKTKRLTLLLDQLSWSLDLDVFHNKKHPNLQIYLHDMLEEAKNHVMALADGLKENAS